MTEREHYSTADELRPGCRRLVWAIMFSGMAILLVIFLAALLQAMR